MVDLQNAGRLVLVGPEEVTTIMRANERKFQKGQLVRIVVHYKHLLPSGQWKDIYNQLATIEDTDEAGWNWQGVPKYGLRSIFADEWLGDFLEDEILEASKCS
jgi:hypothetical protein